MPPPDDVDDYLAVIRAQEACGASWLETVSLTRETGSARSSFGYEIHLFALDGHPSASQAFAWRERSRTASIIYVVLRLPPVEKAADAFRMVLRRKVRLVTEHLAHERWKRSAN